MLQYATTEDEPFSNMGGSANTMWPLCLSTQIASGEFESVSTHAYVMGIAVGTRYVIRFAPHNNTYALSYTTANGEVNVYGHYTWSLAQLWRDSLSGGQDTRQAELDLGVVANGKVNGMCVATDKHVGSFTSQLGVATFNVSGFSS